jgi:excisionase family DNA binding protein
MRIQALSTHPDAFVTVRELAAYWVVSPRQIYKQICQGSLPAVSVGRRSYRIPTKAAAEFERRMTVRPGNGNDRGDNGNGHGETRQFPNLALIRGRDSASNPAQRQEQDDHGWPRAVPDPVADPSTTRLPEVD